jgi:hypothetical protein
VSSLVSGVHFRPHRVTLVGALGGMLAAVGRDLPQPYLMGATGHAFRLTLDLVLSPGSPHELNFHEVLPLWENLGVWCKRVSAKPNDAEFGEIRTEALLRMRESLDRGRPVIAYDLLELPEYGLVVGYDAERLACLTLGNEAEPQWQAAADWPPAAHQNFTRSEVITLLDLAPEFDRRRAEAASLRFAVEHFWAPPGRDMWLQHGLKAWEFWIGILASPLPLHGGEDPGMGHSYNLMVLHRARQDAATYLAEMAHRYPAAPTLADAAVAYGQLVELLAEGMALLPFPGKQGLANTETRKALVDCLRKAMAAEQRAVEQIERALRAFR